ncbi:MAG TPA: hypothetical protein VEB43_07115 [Anaeromyxobacter sp.]|nr:hypothetical protein [Anaeromyxobacter sp.]
MDPRAYDRFTALLADRLSSDPDVLGLVALGSMSGLPPPPDRFSDHDFFVVTRAGAQERLRANPGWLPEPGRIVLWHRETAHGMKAIWDDGHLAELAVFDLEELALARVNRFRVLLDRADVARRMEAVRAATAASAPRPDLRFEAGQLLGALLVGGQRAARGERLSAGQLVRAHAAGHFLRLLEAAIPAAPGAVPDDLDPFRRVERGWPGPARALDAALARPPAEAARALLAIADATFREVPAVPWPAAAAAAVGAALAAADPAAPP